MAQRELSFIYGRAPRAAGLSDKALDKHKDLICDLYLTQNHTRDQVVAYLKEELDFKISPSQFSKATRRWGFHKQPHGGTSTRQTSCETAIQHTVKDPANGLSYKTNSVDITNQELFLENESGKRQSVASSTTLGSDTATLDPSLPLSWPSAKQPDPDVDRNITTVQSSSHLHTDSGSDGEITLSSPTAEESSELSLSHQFMKDAQVSAEYLACCYHYKEAFGCYSTISIPFEDKMYSAKQRRARMLDMARVAETRRSCGLVRRMLETELEMSNDPLAEERYTQSSPKKVEMCRMQSFLFHLHLARIYARQTDGAMSMQEHLYTAQKYMKTFHTHGPVSIDLWTLLYIAEETTSSKIPEELLHSLQWDYESYGLNIEHCLRYCWGVLNPSKPMDEALKGYDAGQHVRTEPKRTTAFDLVLQNSPFYHWKKSSVLFTFLWKEIQLAHGTLRWESGHLTISSALILMIVSRLIVKRTSLIYNHGNDVFEQKEHQQEIGPTDLHLYCDALLGVFHDIMNTPDHIKREFATEFVEHHTWSPLLDPKSALAPHRRSYPIEVLKSVLAARRDKFFTVGHLSIIIEAWTTLPKKATEKQGVSTDSDLSTWLGEHEGQRGFRYLENVDVDTYVHSKTYLSPTSNSSCSTAPVSSHRRYLVTRNGNPTMSRPLASHSSCSSQRSYSSSLQRFKAAALSRQHQPKPTMALSENSDVLMDEDFLEDLQEDECLGDEMVV
ncbi:hypothetical protein ACHAP5_005127 [Fusarium lateritium]